MNIKLSFYQSQVIKAKKKIAEEHMRKAIEAAIQTAEGASSNGKTYCISLVDVGSDTTAIREAVVKVMEQKVLGTFLLKLSSTYYFLNYQHFLLVPDTWFSESDLLMLGDGNHGL